MAETPPPAALTEAVGALWRIQPPGPNNLWSDPRFVRLRDACESLYPSAGSKDAIPFAIEFALSNAVRALGLPSGLVSANAHLAVPVNIAAAQLDAAFRQTQASRLYLCPLDFADDDLPTLKFGPNSIQKFTAAELEALVDPPRLLRINPNWTFDAKRFAEFSWLVVNETSPLNRKPVQFLSMPIDLNEDSGRIEPHRERLPAAVEAALVAILRAPWEDWMEEFEFDWRSFKVPWFYEVNDDLFVRPAPPPFPDALSWEPDFFHDENGEVLETERPIRYGLKDTVVEASTWLNDATWSDLTRARQSQLFKTPIAHFFVRAFLVEPLDEFLAHITTIEAALGLESDYAKRGGTKRVAARVSALLGAKTDGEDYHRLFNIRSSVLHGRTMNDPIPGKERIAARRLARRVINELIKAALAEPTRRSREDYLNDLG